MIGSQRVAYGGHSNSRVPARRGVGRRKTLAVILPALNEEQTIAAVIQQIPRDVPGVARIEVIVVDDGSTDQTAALARETGATVIEHRTNLGLGVAIATGIDAALTAGADIIVQLDSDGQFDPADMMPLIHMIDVEGYGLATCTRYAVPELVPQMPWIKIFGGRWISRLVNVVISNAHFTDVSCGFRAYSRETAMKLVLFSAFTYTQESLIDLASKGVRIAEVPLRVRGVREFGASRIASNVWSYGAKTLAIILRAFRDKRPLAFFGIPAMLLLAASFLSAGGCAAAFWLAPTNSWLIGGLLVASLFQFQLAALGTAVALVSDQIARVRKIQEQALLLSRRVHYDRVPAGAGAEQQADATRREASYVTTIPMHVANTTGGSGTTESLSATANGITSTTLPTEHAPSK